MQPKPTFTNILTVVLFIKWEDKNKVNNYFKT